MIISIQPLDNKGNPCSPYVKTRWSSFVYHNGDGFGSLETWDMQQRLKQGETVTIGGGATPIFELKEVEPD